MDFHNINELAVATLELVQGAVLPILGVCLAVSILFFILQIVLSLQDFNLQFLVRLVLLVVLGLFMAKGFSEKYLEYTKAVFKAAPEMVR